jgi:hypothetical protein
MQAEGKPFVRNSQTHSIWNKEESPQKWKESITVNINKKAINCINYLGISLINYMQNVIQHSPLNSIRGRSYWESSVRISSATRQVSCIRWTQEKQD